MLRQHKGAVCNDDATSASLDSGGPGERGPLAGAPEHPPPAAPPEVPSRPAAPRRGKMAQEAGDMDDGQVSDSDSDMTVAPSDRPLPVPVSAEGRRVTRGPERGAQASSCRARGARQAAGRRRALRTWPGI